MSTINERIRELRQTLHLTQTAFGEGIGVKIGVIRNFEYNITTPSDEQIKLISYVYSVNEDWLRTGHGEMIRKNSDEELVAAFVGCSIPKSDSIQMRCLLALANLSDHQWSVIGEIVDQISPTQCTPKNKKDSNNILTDFLNQLNAEGRTEAVKRTEELTHIPKYTDKENGSDSE